MFQILDRGTNRGMYYSELVLDAKGQRVQAVDRNNKPIFDTRGTPVWKMTHEAYMPVVQQFLGGNEAEPFAVTGTLTCDTPENKEGDIFDLDITWLYLGSQEIVELARVGFLNPAGHILTTIQTRRMPETALVFCFDFDYVPNPKYKLDVDEKRDAGYARTLAHTYGLDLTQRPYAVGQEMRTATMEVAITTAALAHAQAVVFQGCRAWPATLSGDEVEKVPYRNRPLVEAVQEIRTTGKLSPNPRAQTAREAAATAAATAFQSRRNRSNAVREGGVPF